MDSKEESRMRSGQRSFKKQIKDFHFLLQKHTIKRSWKDMVYKIMTTLKTKTINPNQTNHLCYSVEDKLKSGGSKDIISVLSQSPEEGQECFGDTDHHVVSSPDSTNLMPQFGFQMHSPLGRTRALQRMVDSRAAAGEMDYNFLNKNP